MTFEWKSPPITRSPKGQQNKFEQMAAVIKQKPNTWALVRTGALYIPAAFQGDNWVHRWHEVSKSPRVHELYVMYVTEAQN